MTREDLLQKVSAAIDETLYAYSHGEMSDDMAKESILALIPPQPKLEWRTTAYGICEGWLGSLRVADLRINQAGDWVNQCEIHGRPLPEARAAVEDAVREALGWVE